MMFGTKLLSYFFSLTYKRSISEVQLMHNVREHKEMLERQDWLQLKLNNILIPSLNDSQKEQKGKNNGPSIRRLRKGD
ncbi:Parathyroid hormone [Anabarilius grahami]|uniref:Parathyroid hormone n=1 Tax=Anabarilius grahami TaxID=495550 RepID=A0A3N0Y4R2_ANAGA|nr:Parathyroid hormone [Anabarilius grahami]